MKLQIKNLSLKSDNNLMKYSSRGSSRKTISKQDLAAVFNPIVNGNIDIN